MWPLWCNTKLSSPQTRQTNLLETWTRMPHPLVRWVFSAVMVAVSVQRERSWWLEAVAWTPRWRTLSLLYQERGWACAVAVGRADSSRHHPMTMTPPFPWWVCRNCRTLTLHVLCTMHVLHNTLVHVYMYVCWYRFVKLCKYNCTFGGWHTYMYNNYKCGLSAVAWYMHCVNERTWLGSL